MDELLVFASYKLVKLAGLWTSVKEISEELEFWAEFHAHYVDKGRLKLSSADYLKKIEKNSDIGIAPINK